MNRRKTSLRAAAVAGAIALVPSVTLINAAQPANAAVAFVHQSFSGTSDGGTVTLTHIGDLSAVTLPTKFDLRFTNGDHQLATVSLLGDSSLLTKTRLSFEDKNFDDPYTYAVGLTTVEIPGAIYPPRLEVECGGGTCAFPIDPRAGTSSYYPVIRGFFFGFEGPDNASIFTPPIDFCTRLPGCADREMADIGIEFDGGTVWSTYADTGRTDDYKFMLDYVLVPRSQVQRTVTVSPTVEDSGHAVRVLSPATLTTIGGFRYSNHLVSDGHIPPGYYRPDYEVRRLALDLTNDRIETYFKDSDGGTTTQFTVKAVQLR